MHTLCMRTHTRALESKFGFSLFSFVSSTCLVSVLSCCPCFQFCFGVLTCFWFLLVIISWLGFCLFEYHENAFEYKHLLMHRCYDVVRWIRYVMHKSHEHAFKHLGFEFLNMLGWILWVLMLERLDVRFALWCSVVGDICLIPCFIQIKIYAWYHKNNL